MKKQTVHPVVAELRRIRLEQGMLQRELAALTGYHVVTISRWEQGHRDPDLDQLADWASALGRDVELVKKREER